MFQLKYNLKKKSSTFFSRNNFLKSIFFILFLIISLNILTFFYFFKAPNKEEYIPDNYFLNNQVLFDENARQYFSLNKGDLYQLNLGEQVILNNENSRNYAYILDVERQILNVLDKEGNRTTLAHNVSHAWAKGDSTDLFYFKYLKITDRGPLGILLFYDSSQDKSYILGTQVLADTFIFTPQGEALAWISLENDEKDFVLNTSLLNKRLEKRVIPKFLHPLWLSNEAKEIILLDFKTQTYKENEPSGKIKFYYSTEEGMDELEYPHFIEQKDGFFTYDFYLDIDNFQNLALRLEPKSEEKIKSTFKTEMFSFFTEKEREKKAITYTEEYFYQPYLFKIWNRGNIKINIHYGNFISLKEIKLREQLEEQIKNSFKKTEISESLELNILTTSFDKKIKLGHIKEGEYEDVFLLVNNFKDEETIIWLNLAEQLKQKNITSFFQKLDRGILDNFSFLLEKTSQKDLLSNLKNLLVIGVDDEIIVYNLAEFELVKKEGATYREAYLRPHLHYKLRENEGYEWLWQDKNKLLFKILDPNFKLLKKYKYATLNLKDKELKNFQKEDNIRDLYPDLEYLKITPLDNFLLQRKIFNYFKN